MDLGSLGRFCVSIARSVQPAKSPLGYSENFPGAGTKDPTLGTIAAKSATKVCEVKNGVTVSQPCAHWTYVWRLNNRT